MRRVRYSVAISLDGYIADPNGGFDWIIMDPAIDFEAFFGGIDTVLMGRLTYELSLRQGRGGMPGMRTYVFSSTLDAADHPNVTIVAHDAAGTVQRLRAQDGKDIWLMGGGELFRSLLEARAVDTVEVGVIPILLGRGIPFLPATERSAKLELNGHEAFPTGIVLLRYDLQYAG